jgi:hypothetical protein
VWLAAQVTYALPGQGVHGTSTPLGSATIPLATATIDLDVAEYFTNISGTILTNPGSAAPVRVASLGFSTNKQVYGPFGNPTLNQPFAVQGPVYAFHGAVGRGNTTDILTAIGFWKLPASNQLVTAIDD